MAARHAAGRLAGGRPQVDDEAGTLGDRHVEPEELVDGEPAPEEAGEVQRRVGEQRILVVEPEGHAEREADPGIVAGRHRPPHDRRRAPRVSHRGAERRRRSQGARCARVCRRLGAGETGIAPPPARARAKGGLREK